MMQSAQVGARAAPKKQVILFLAANPSGTDRLALDQEARSIPAELKRSGFRDRFDFVTRWAWRRTHGGGGGIGAQPRCRRGIRAFGWRAARSVLPRRGRWRAGGFARRDRADARCRGASVKVVVLNACFTAPIAEALLVHVDCVFGNPFGRDAGAPITRGGCWYHSVLSARSMNRAHTEPTQRHRFIGVRVCATPR